MALDFGSFLKNIGIGGNKTTPVTQNTAVNTQPSFGSRFMEGLKKVGGNLLDTFNRQQESLYGKTDGSYGDQLKSSLPGQIIQKTGEIAKQGAENYKQNLKLISDPNTQKEFTENVGPLRQAATNYTLGPLAQVPYNIKQAADKTKSGTERVLSGVNAAFGAAQVIPGFTGVDDLVMAMYNGLKGVTKEQKEGKSTIESYKNAVPYLTGQKNAGLGDVFGKTDTQKTIGNIAELPLLVFGGLTVAKKKQAMETIVNSQDDILRAIRGIRNYDSFTPQTQMQIIQEAIDVSKKIIPDVVGSKEMKQLSIRDPKEWMNTVSKFMEDRLVSAKNPEFNIGLNTRTLKNLPKDVINSGEYTAKSVGPVIEPGMREKGLITTVKNTDQLSSATKNLAEGVYPQIHNAETYANAEKSVLDNYDQVYKDVLSPDKWDADISAQSIVMAKKLDLEGKFTEADAIIDAAADKALRAGQANQVLSLLSTKTVKGMEDFAKKVIDQANEKRTGIVNKLFGVKKVDFTKELQDKISSLMTEVRQLPEGAEKNAKLTEVLGEIGKNIPPTATELIDAYRYNNMLSNPNTWGPTGRNTWYNLMQTFLTKPAQMGFETLNDVVLSTLTGKERTKYLKDIPNYYKNVVNQIPQAAQASIDILRGKTSILNPDIANITTKDMTDLVRATRMDRIPGAAKIFSNMMEMNDKFFSSLISSGEFAVQKSKGVDDATAKESATKMAEYFLGRSTPDASNKTGQGALLSAIDSFESWLVSGRKNAPVKWMIPFINMATQVAKQTIEFSPLGLATLYKNTNKASQLAKVELGTAATLLSTLLVASNNVTLDAPKDEEEKKIFYASGRKPYSIKIGDAWVPINIFGPLSLSIGTVAAWKYQHEQAPDKFTTSEYKKMANVLMNQFQRFAQQPMLQGLNNLSKLLAGETDYTTESTLGFSAGQVIPYNGLLRYIATVIDPVMRSVKGEGFLGSIKKDLPFLSKQLLPYLDPEGNPSKRNITDYASPYSMGFSNAKYDELYQQLQDVNQIKGLSTSGKSQINQILKRIENISQDTSLSDDDRQKKLDIEGVKLEKISNELDKNFNKAEPFIQPK